MIQISLASWPITSLFGLALRLCGPIVIGTIGQTKEVRRPSSYIFGRLSKNELHDLIYLATGFRANTVYTVAADWIHERLQPISLHYMHELLQGHIFDTTVWEQAARWQQTITKSLSTTSGPTAPVFIPGTTVNKDNPKPDPVIQMHLGEWDDKEMFGLAVAVAGQILVGTRIQGGWDANTFLHETWGFEWEELAALIYLSTGHRTDRVYEMTLEHFYATIMQPRDFLRLYKSVRGDIYNTSAWLAVAHARLDQDTAIVHNTDVAASS